MAGKKECPSCAMEIDELEKICPICGYEFPRTNPVYTWIAVILLFITLVFFIFRFIF